jgi:Ser-tRNA(Ala) deacylase AlaX
MTKLNEAKPYDVTVVDEEIEINYSSIDIDMNMDTITMICKEIDDLSEITNKDDIKNIIKDLYQESLTIDD